MTVEQFAQIKRLIQEAEETGLLSKARNLTGFSGEKLIGALQRIAKYQESIGAGVYLEIGVFQGLTLLSVAGVLRGSHAFGIDNFSQFDTDKKNQGIINERARDNELTNYTLINSDYEDALERLEDHLKGAKIGTYFVDGPHDYRSQLVCLQLAKPYLSPRAVIVVDDCNYRHVRLANRDFLLANPEFKLFFESYTYCHPGNMDKGQEQQVRKGWWNGVNIIVHDPNNLLEKWVPETFRDRRLYENDHLVHSLKYGALAPNAVSFVQQLMSCRLWSALNLFREVVRTSRRLDRQLVGPYSSMNTYSEDLPQGLFNPKIR